MRVRLVLLGALAIAGCSYTLSAAPDVEPDDSSAIGSETAPAVSEATSELPERLDPDRAQAETEPPREIAGIVVSAIDGAALAGATVSVGERSMITGADGTFELSMDAAGEPLEIARPAWQPASIDPPDGRPIRVELEPMVVRGLRVARHVAADPDRFDALLSMADRTTVNALVFDTKDESNLVLYDSDVSFAHEIGAVDPVYDPAELLAKAADHDLYAITRIVTFEDSRWAKADPDAALAGAWVDPGRRQNWDYPIDLAVEACQLGFDEIQFDYVRFPAGRTAVVAASLIPRTSEDRAAVIAGFLDRARSALTPLGCGVSAAVFGIVMSSASDEGIGQTPESVSAVTDAVSPMLYPSHYGRGWLGFADPNDQPGPVVAHALDAGADRLEQNTAMRPWLQGFGYNGDQVLAQITEAERRGAGWMIWNAVGRYELASLPPS